MEASTTRIPPARIVALALIAIAVLALGYLRLASGDGAVSVPSGAKAGDLELESCEYPTESGRYAADCGTLVVPENRADPRSRLIALPVTRIRAESGASRVPVFRLEGGPGKSNLEFPAASRFASDRDVVLVGYRGADGSSILDCPEVESALKHSTDYLGEGSHRAYGDAFRACADRLTADGVDLAGYSLAERADDLEAARAALGYDRIDLLSESAGTRYAMVYAWRHPERVHRSVMLGANPPGGFVWDASTYDELLGRYAELCARDEGCRERTDDLAATLGRGGAAIPDRWLFLPIAEGNVRVASYYGLVESSFDAAGPISAPSTFDAWLSAAEGDASGFWLQSLLADVAFPESFVWGELAATGHADARAARRHFASGDPHVGSRFIWGGGALADAWPAFPTDDDYAAVRSSDVETLLVNGELDFATPPQLATEQLLPHLPKGSQVVLPGFGHTATFWEEQPEAGTRLITAYLDTGRVDDSLYEPQAIDFSPTVTAPLLAKAVAAAIVVLPLVAALSLLWLAGRVRSRGGLGRKASAVLRSAYPVVLGLGGWLAGVLLVLTTMPGVPLDDELLAALSVGAPIGLGLYLAWVRRDRPATARAIAFAAAAGGALLGAWLGHHAVDGLAALFTTVLGATAGGNLVLVALDIAWDGHARRRVEPQDAVEARPSVV